MQSIPEDIQNLITFKAANVWSEREQTGLQYLKYSDFYQSVYQLLIKK